MVVCGLPRPGLNAGTARLTLEAAPPDSGAAWRLIFELKIGLGEGMSVVRTENALIAPDLTLLSFKSSYDQDAHNDDAW